MTNERKQSALSKVRSFKHSTTTSIFLAPNPKGKANPGHTGVQWPISPNLFKINTKL